MRTSSNEETILVGPGANPGRGCGNGLNQDCSIIKITQLNNNRKDLCESHPPAVKSGMTIATCDSAKHVRTGNAKLPIVLPSRVKRMTYLRTY
jgi:hypothetical protein